VIYRLLADLTMGLHFAFIMFVGLGGLLAARRTWLAWIHVPAALWGTLITFFGWTCPLTPLENHLRHLGGQAGYANGFIEHYLVPLIYPEGVGRAGWIALGVSVIAVNVAIYTWIYQRSRRPDARG